MERIRPNLKDIETVVIEEGTLFRFFNETQIGMLRKALKILECHMDMLGKDEVPKPTKKDVKKVRDAAQIIFNATFVSEFTPLFKDVVYNLSVLIENWNANTIKNKTIRAYAANTRRVVASLHTMDSFINVSRQIIKRLERLLQYESPALDLAKHHVQLIQGGEKDEK